MNRVRLRTVECVAFVGAIVACATACSSPKVDPGPQPSICGGDASLSTLYTATSIWVRVDGGSVLELYVTVHKADPLFTGHLTFTPENELTNVTTASSGDYVLVLRPRVGLKQVAVGIDVSCLNTHGTLTVTWTADAVEGRNDPVTVAF